mgnify:CR=1 FL=1
MPCAQLKTIDLTRQAGCVRLLALDVDGVLSDGHPNAFLEAETEVAPGHTC